MTSGPVEIFFNDAATAAKEYPAVRRQADRRDGTRCSSRSTAIDALHDRIKDRVKIVMPIVTQFYGMREFAIEDPDGYVITFAERVGQLTTRTLESKLET